MAYKMKTKREFVLFLIVSLLVGLHLSLPVKAEEKAAAEQNYKNTLRWSTASEVDNFGFDVYRAENEEGPFERITKQPLSGAGTTDIPSRYEYVDDMIKPNTVYYYYVESISMSGERQKFTPTFKAPVKTASPISQDSHE